MRKNLIPLLAVALVIAGLCTVVFYGLIADRFGPAPTGAQAAPLHLVAAARAVVRGKALEAADMRIAEVPCPVKAPSACFHTVEELLGRPATEALVEGQPLTDDLVVKRRNGSSPSANIPLGWRAVTLHAADSRGVVEMIRPGDHVDLQVIGTPVLGQLDNQQPLVVQRVWSDVEVLTTAAPDPGSSHNGRPVVTVLMPPVEAERLSLADTASRIRVVLRNREEGVKPVVTAAAVPPASPAAVSPLPATTVPAKTVPAATVPAVTVPAKPAPAAAPAPAAIVPANKPANAPAANLPPAPRAANYQNEPKLPATGEPSFLVRLVSITPAQLAGLAGASGAANGVQPQVRALPRRELEDRLTRLEMDKSARVIGSRPVAVGARQEAALAFTAGGAPLASLRSASAAIGLQLRALADRRWRVQPEAQTGATGEAAARRAETDLPLDPQQAWLISGLLEHKEGRPVLAGQGSENEPKLVLLVTPIPR